MTAPLAAPPERPASWLGREPSRVPEAFSINFSRHTTLLTHLHRALVSFAAGYLLAAVVCCCLLFGLTFWTHLDARRLQQQLGNPVEFAGEQGMRQAMADLQAKAALETTQLNAMSAQLATRFPVGTKLAALTTTLPARTWVTGLEAKREGRTLTIRAAYLIDAEHPYDLPTTPWIAALKVDPGFGRGLKRLDLQSSSRKTQGRSELFVFTLSAEWAALP